MPAQELDCPLAQADNSAVRNPAEAHAEVNARAANGKSRHRKFGGQSKRGRPTRPRTDDHQQGVARRRWRPGYRAWYASILEISLLT